MIFSQNSHFKLIFSITMLLSHCWVRSLFCRPYENWPNNEPPGQEVLWNCSVDLFSNTQMCAVVAVLCLIRIGLNVWGSGLGTVILMVDIRSRKFFDVWAQFIWDTIVVLSNADQALFKLCIVFHKKNSNSIKPLWIYAPAPSNTGWSATYLYARCSKTGFLEPPYKCCVA